MAARKVKKTKSGIFFIIVIAIFICGMLIFKNSELKKEKQALEMQYAQVQIEIEDALIERELTKQQIKYQQTDEYIKDQARYELGLVEPYDVIFVPAEE